MKDREITIIQWSGIEIEISFCRNWSNAFARIYGFNMCHFEVKTCSPERAALPITDTGYRSIFINEPEIADFANPVDYIIALLNDAAKNPEWKEAQDEAVQYTLF